MQLSAHRLIQTCGAVPSRDDSLVVADYLDDLRLSVLPDLHRAFDASSSRRD